MKKNKLFRFLTMIVMCALMVASIPVMNSSAAPKTDLSFLNQVFDAEYYYNTYPDVAAAFGNDSAKLLNHYVTFGMAEGRNASANFNATVYKNNYPDLQAAFGDDDYAYIRHYVEFGMAEGRNASNGQVFVTANAAPSTQGTVVGTYSTKFNAKIPRATNVRLAATQVNGRVLQPGETFSFLNSITPRTRENGYVVAPVFSNKRVSTGIGGGICQVSSTIYAAVLGSSCRVDERHPHSLPVTYMPKDMDATVSAPSLDFRFTNTYDQPLLMSVVESETGVLTVNLILQ